MLSRTTTLFSFFSLLVLSSVAAAQTTGSIRGTVKDNTDSVLPGVVVTITSPALIGGAKTAVTNGIGVYRFPALAVGVYAVEASLQGFQTTRIEDVRVGLNATTTVNPIMQLSTVTESVTVTGRTPVLDITDSSHSTSWKQEMVDDLPTNRNFWDFAQMSPGVASYSADGQGSSIQAFGSAGQSNSWNVDGIPVTSGDTGASWWWVNTDMIEEVEILGVGASAEYGNSMGATVNIVTKSGGNDFHGGGNFFFQHEALTSEKRRGERNSFQPGSVSRFHRPNRRPLCSRPHLVLRRLSAST